jgi:deoxyribodipyrimidine photo-lyase
MRTAVVLFTRDLRVHDHRALRDAVPEYEQVVPLFVVDDCIVGSDPAPNRASFLIDALADLRESLRKRGGNLVIRRGDPVGETVRLARTVGATAVFVSADASGYAETREKRLARACERERFELRISDAHTVVPPGLLTPDGSDHYRVFTPYWRRWRTVGSRRWPELRRACDCHAKSVPASFRRFVR